VRKYWFVIRSLESYRQHNDYIGKEEKKARKIEKIKRGDKEKWENDVY